MSVPVLVVLVMCVEALLHYFPWRLVLKCKLPRVAAYTLGVLGMMVPFSVWLWEACPSVLGVMWLVITAGGATVAALYALDWVVVLSWKHKEAKELLDATQKGQD